MTRPRADVRRIEAFLTLSTRPVYALDHADRLIAVNPAWERWTGVAGDHVLGLVCRPPIAGEPGEFGDLAAALMAPEEARQGRACGRRSRFVLSSGEARWSWTEFWPIEVGPAGSRILLARLGDVAGSMDDREARSVALRSDMLALRDRLRSAYGTDQLLGQGPAHRRLLDQVAAASRTDLPILIVGEPGTGKRLVGRVIHQIGHRSASPLIPIDARALPADVLERELFRTDDRGMTTGFALPDGAVLLLADLLALPRDLQARVVAAIEGDVRLIATSRIPPEEALEAERLRPDLYYRVSGMVIRLRPLRQRSEEIPLLAEQALERANLRGVTHCPGLDAGAVDALARHDWPGNFPELTRVIEAAAREAGGGLVRPEHLPAEVRGGPVGGDRPAPPPAFPAPLDVMLERVERELIERALKRSRGNKSRAAEALGISRPRLHRRMLDLGLAEPAGPDEAEPRSPSSTDPSD